MMKKRILRSMKTCAAGLAAAVLLLAGCGQSAETADTSDTGKAETETSSVSSASAASFASSKEDAKTVSEPEDTASSAESEEAPELAGLTFESQMELKYAECFDVYYYNDGFALIDVHDSARYLVVPENETVPEGLDADIIVLQQPLDSIYLAATSAMALFDAMDGLDSLKFSSLQASGWYIENAAKAMESGALVCAGKYSEPDYELLIDGGCNLAIESTMILHTPKVQEMIEMLGIPVFIDRSSYESHPLGRTEWIKAYSVLLDKEEEAEAFFEEQASVISELKDFPNTEKTIAYFYISTDGTAVVRTSSDYIPKMMEIAGGRYVFEDLSNTESTSASVSLTMEEFYAAAVDADYLIYNGTIDTPISSMDELLAKSALFADFKAVKEGNVWCVGKYFYQATDIVGELITDMNLMLTDGDPDQMTFLTKVE